MNTRSLSIVLVGIGGYGNNYVSTLLDAQDKSGFSMAGAVDPTPDACKRLSELVSAAVPIYPSLEAFYASRKADLAVISSPLQLHASQTSMALSRGSSVLCEKPLCSTPDEAAGMLQTQKQSGRQVAIGYQWSFSKAVQALKADVLAGLLGKPIRFRSLVLWPRDEAYYQRNRWAGRKQDSQGNWVLDSPVNNACAHYLHNMLYVLGPAVDRSAIPQSLTAELYRAHPIENYDTAAIRFKTAGNVELLFVVSHATSHRKGPILTYEFEKATVSYSDGADDSLTAVFKNGVRKNYGSPNADMMRKLWLTLESAEQEKPSLCGIEAAYAHTQCVWALQQGVPTIANFPSKLMQTSGPVGSRRVVVTGLQEQLSACFDQWMLPSEMSLAWASPATTVAVDDSAIDS